jgi:hypothetical protein
MKIAHEASASASGEEARRLYASAMENERAAANFLETALEIEPTRAILYRSAASLALRCQEYREAERLIAKGLAGEPPEEIAEEMRDLMERAHFERHLALDKVMLGDDEFQLSVAGQGIAPGIAGDGFIARFRTAQRVFLRIAQEFLGKTEEVKQRFKFFLVATQPASFAVTVRVGQEFQGTIDVSLNPIPGLIDEFIECIDLFQDGSEEEMERRMPDETYRRDMTQLIHQLAPDGREVSLVGVARRREGKEKKAALTRRPETLMPTMDGAKSVMELEAQLYLRPQEIFGQLLYANEMQRDPKIILLDSAGNRHPILVRDVSMEDIVKPLWGKRVRARVFRRKASDRLPRLLEVFEDF